MLRHLREAAGLSQSELSRRMGLLQSSVSRWESGEAVPATRHLPALAEVLGLDDRELGRLVRSFGDSTSTSTSEAA